MTNVKTYQGDVRKICPKLKQKFNRILMPLPATSENFLDVAFSCVKKKGMIHFYSWGEEEDLFSNASNVVKKAAKLAKKKIRIRKKKK